MRYILTMLTNGRLECFERTLNAFLQYADPLPERAFLMDDGGATRAASVPGVPSLDEILAECPFPWEYESQPVSIGACKAQAHCWHTSATSDLPWAFHLEDDFVIVRPLRLDDLRRTIEFAEPELKQMALVRAPWAREIEWGGYIQQSPGWYERRSTDFACSNEWIATTRNWANCPALYRTDLCRKFPWPQENCETMMARNIVEDEPGAVFGLWGWGEPWCAHIGVDRTAGAHGY